MKKPEDPNELEKNVSQKIYNDLAEHVNYINDIYNLCFLAQNKFNDAHLVDIEHHYMCINMILMRITDFMRSALILCGIGYPEQAATLAASIIELSQTAILLRYYPELSEVWIEAQNNPEKDVPKIFNEKNKNQDKINGWKDIMKINLTNQTENEIEQILSEHHKIYKILCKIKHSHPITHYMIADENNALYKAGPYDDEASLITSYLAMLTSGHFTLIVLEVCYTHLMSGEENENIFHLKKKTEELDQKYNNKISDFKQNITRLETAQ